MEWGVIQPNVPGFVPMPTLPFGVHFVELDGGHYHTLARLSDGTVVTWGVMQQGEHRVPQPWPGTSVVQIAANFDSSLIRIGPPSTYVGFARGCAGTLPPARLVPRDTPFLGERQIVNVFDLPQNAAFMVFGWNRQAPASLASLGMPGCFQHITADAAVLLLGQHGFARFELPIPQATALLGQRFHNQAIVLDSAANGLGAVVSDAAEAVIGVR